MRYTASLDGKELASGTMQEVTVASAGAVTDLLAQDPDGVAMSAQTAIRAFRTGAVADGIREYGQWETPFWVKGARRTLTVREA